MKPGLKAKCNRLGPNCMNCCSHVVDVHVLSGRICDGNSNDTWVGPKHKSVLVVKFKRPGFAFLFFF